jgi:arylsulfatase A
MIKTKQKNEPQPFTWFCKPVTGSSLMKGILPALLIGLTTSVHAAADKPTTTGKPNIIFILADDLGIPGVGCYGGAFKTPNLDKLAATGIRFEYCYSAPECAPSRALAMFGRYAFRTGVTDNKRGRIPKPDKEVCIAKTMKTGGYATAIAGKWGWDEFMTWGTDDGEKGNRYWDPDYNKNGQMLTGVKDKFGPDLLHEFVVDFIRRHRDGPFFVYYPMTLIHVQLMRTPDNKGGEQSLDADNIAYMDKLVGKLVAELEALKLRENTLIIFSGDNGCKGTETINGRPVDGHKCGLNEGGNRVPLIANCPGFVPAGKVCTDLVDFSDFYTTFAEFGGAKLPEGVTLDSHSFAPQLRGEKGTPRDWVYVQYFADCYVRDPRWKLTGDGKLFDMADAPFSEKPATDEAARNRLQAVLDKLNPAPASTGKKQAKTERKSAK